MRDGWSMDMKPFYNKNGCNSITNHNGQCLLKYNLPTNNPKSPIPIYKLAYRNINLFMEHIWIWDL